MSDSQYAMDADTVASATAFVHPLMVLGFDVYFDPVERTVTRLEGLRFDLATVHEDTWEGRPVWVVGAPVGDLRTRQFWVDRERLVFVRLLEPGRRDTTRMSDIRFNKYQPLGPAWLSAEVAFVVDGHEQWLEEYTEIKTDVKQTDIDRVGRLLKEQPLIAKSEFVSKEQAYKTEKARNPKAYELLAIMLIFEAMFGLAGLVMAPIVYAYAKAELRAAGWL